MNAADLSADLSAETSTDPTPSSRTLLRGLAVLEAVATAEGGAQVSAIAAQLKLDKGTVSRLLATLRSLGYVYQRADRRFELGSKSALLAGRYHDRTKAIWVTAAPYLTVLCEQARETVHLAVREGPHMVYIAQEQPDRAIRVHSAVGTRLPLHGTAMGRALLAALGPEEREDLLVALRVDAFATGDQIDEAGILADVAAAAERGWAAVDRDDDVTRLAAAITDLEPVAAIALSGPSHRMEPHLAHLATLVVSTAHAISAELSRR